MSYRRFYDSELLDDIHNYFPDILYVPERFRSVTELLAYVQHQTRQRFDLFSRGRREHLENERTRIVSTPPLRMTPVDRATALPGMTMLFESNRNNIPEHVGTADFLNAINLMSGIFNIPSAPIQHTMAQAPPGFMDPVIVRPTGEQIESATAIEIIDSDEEMCAICQDHLTAGTEALSLTACDHRFHSGCIRTWFTGNVVCPVCRHDIREPATD